MIILAKIMELYTPKFFKRRKLNELFRLTADAFQSVLPDFKELSFSECLSKYALFTQEQAESYLQSGQPPDEIKHRLYNGAYGFGQNLRKSLHIVTWEEAVTVLGIIYKLIGIDFQYGQQGQIIVRRCFFSEYYSGGVCRLISSLDEGLAAGLSNGGRLCFKQMITEGSSCCKGFLAGG
jgi:hypothetical protein